jgi:hypothetical protein
VFDESFTAARYEALLRADLAGFAHRAFCELNPRGGFAMNWHVEAITAKLSALRAGRIGRLIVSVPPRHLKSHLASVAFRRGAWVMIRARRFSASAIPRISPTNCRATAGAS